MKTLKSIPVKNIPNLDLYGLPCLLCGAITAKNILGEAERFIGYPNFKKDGYATLNEANKFIRNNFNVKKRLDFKRGQRPLLRDLDIPLGSSALICVYGHFIFAQRLFDNALDYWSFFDNTEDEVVALWLLN